MDAKEEKAEDETVILLGSNPVYDRTMYYIV